MSDIMLALGNFQFGINTAAYQTLRKKNAYRWQGQPLYQQRPVLQFCGLESEIISLGGTLLPHFRGTAQALEPVREMAEKGVPRLLVDALGFVYGKWVVMSVSETLKDFVVRGRATYIDFTMELKKYGD